VPQSTWYLQQTKSKSRETPGLGPRDFRVLMQAVRKGGFFFALRPRGPRRFAPRNMINEMAQIMALNYYRPTHYSFPALINY
jgi:hypothetical protein